MYINVDKSIIICSLSCNNFKNIESLPIKTLNKQSSIIETKNGFKLNIDWMRLGSSNQFRFDKKTRKIQLIGMSHYQLGGATHDGSGESSVNLLTGDYIGNWNYYDDKKCKLIKMPTIKEKMYFNKIFLEDFNDNSYLNYIKKCTELYDKFRMIIINRK